MRSGTVAGTGLVHGLSVVAFASDARVQGRLHHVGHHGEREAFLVLQLPERPLVDIGRAHVFDDGDQAIQQE